MSSNQSAPDILCEDVVRIFRGDGIEVQALQGLNLRVERGEMIAVVGASGSGKSTLLTILSGLDVPSAGKAHVAGIDLLNMTRKQRVHYQRQTVGFIWQQTPRNLLPYLTAAENVELPMALAGRKNTSGLVSDLLELTGVGYCRDRTPAQLSGGEQQRVSIAVAMANEPRIILADEPTGELDEATSADVLEAMRAVNQELDVTTLIVTHDPTVSEHVQRTVQIRDGRCSTETFRRSGVNDDGDEHLIAEEFAVIDKVGRLQLPQDFMSALNMKDRVRLGLEDDHVRVSPHNSTSKATKDQQ
ncbi:ABC transporter ATP-binding protein [Arthrobacter roseus]|uniref:ABC transporter ATP-binding protein n=1 Tax=Arthrobacter roseus TaxID=136274 RepID=UPI0019654F46|nr:ABC transporter ATP-binding protein [Arthrobacter roseus]MBM7849289.1 ABC-type lipoprotein export system ATPase subunit [Arthrobacter roseus]